MEQYDNNVLPSYPISSIQSVGSPVSARGILTSDLADSKPRRTKARPTVRKSTRARLILRKVASKLKREARKGVITEKNKEDTMAIDEGGQDMECEEISEMAPGLLFDYENLGFESEDSKKRRSDYESEDDPYDWGIGF